MDHLLTRSVLQPLTGNTGDCHKGCMQKIGLILPEWNAGFPWSRAIMLPNIHIYFWKVHLHPAWTRSWTAGTISPRPQHPWIFHKA